MSTQLGEAFLGLLFQIEVVARANCRQNLLQLLRICSQFSVTNIIPNWNPNSDTIWQVSELNKGILCIKKNTNLLFVPLFDHLLNFFVYFLKIGIFWKQTLQNCGLFATKMKKYMLETISNHLNSS